MKKEKVIGVIGGMGPYAGLDLVKKIFDNTIANTDHTHLPVALLSYPERIPDRSMFLFGEINDNPADALAEIARQLESVGAVVAGIPCNTAHAPAILNGIIDRLATTGNRIRIINMIEETASYIRTALPDIRTVGVLSTLAVYRLGLYANTLTAAGFEVVKPEETVQENIVNRTIFDTNYGIKAQSNPVSKIARQSMVNAIDHLRDRGAEAIVLGCTELPLAVPEPVLDGTIIIDPTVILARALIRETYPEKLTEGQSTQ